MASPRASIALAESASPRPDLGAWMVTHGARLRRYFSRRAPRAEAEDLVQDVFLHVQAARLDSPIVEVERYLFTVAHNVLVSHARRRRGGSVDAQRTLWEFSEAAGGLSPERILSARQDYARVMAVIERLPPRTRLAFRLNRFEELSYGAIAERMGITKDSVKELLRRAHAHLDQAVKRDT
uniref:RNA polymerase, sigma-24 subunit, ECF subfamily n=1 Tax=Caulobacter sp. (strain K31) TaxID=366602 RepID=B0SXL1_CAUSK